MDLLNTENECEQRRFSFYMIIWLAAGIDFVSLYLREQKTRNDIRIFMIFGQILCTLLLLLDECSVVLYAT